MYVPGTAVEPVMSSSKLPDLEGHKARKVRSEGSLASAHVLHMLHPITLIQPC